MTGRRRPAVAAGALLALALATPSLASWVVGGSGAVAGTAGSLGTPTALSTSDITESALVLSWTAPSGLQPERYVVHRDGVLITSCTSASPTATSCRDAGLTADTAYRYTVAAVLKGWQGSSSDAVSARTARPAPTDTTAPTLLSLRRAGTSATTNASTVSWTATFSEPVTGVDTNDFRLSTALAGASLTGVTGSGTTWTVTASTGTGDGPLGLDLVDNDTIVDAAGLTLSTGTGGVVTGETYTIDKTALTVTVARAAAQPAVTNSAFIQFTVTFSKPVTDFVASDVTLGGAAGPTTATISGSGSSYTVAVTGMTAQGSVTMSVRQGVATGAAGGTNTASNEASVTYDSVRPTVTAVSLANGGAGGVAGTVNQGDSVVLRFSEALDAGSVCSTLSGTGGEHKTNPVLVTLVDRGANDALTFTSTDCVGGLHIGEVLTGGNYLLSGSRSFGGNGSNDRSGVVVNPDGQVVVTLGRVSSSGGTLLTGVPAGTPTATPDTAVKDVAGNTAAATPFTATTASRF